jgi:DNA-binding MarR family transcriptional regulator
MEGGSMTISEAEILDAIREAASNSASGPDDAMTIVELAEAMNVDARIVRKHVAALLKSGGMECVRVRRPSMDGRIMPVPAYRLIAPKIAPKKKGKR